MNMKKIVFIAALYFIMFSAFSQDFNFKAEPQADEYIQYINSFDWGPATDRIMICLDHKISESAVNKNDFAVKVHLVSKTNSAQSYGPALSNRIVTDAYICNPDGTKATGRSSLIMLMLEVHPDAIYSKPYVSFKKPSGIDDLYGYKIENKKLEFEIGRRTAYLSSSLNQFSLGNFDGSEDKMNYAVYIPESSKKSEEKIPLIVWFHGLSEGGDYPWTPLLGNPVPNLAGEKIQKHFKNGAAVLVPQSKVCWLLGNTKDKRGNNKWVIFDDVMIKKNIAGKIMVPFSKISSTSPYGKTNSEENTVSKYTSTVKELIDSILKENPRLDKDKVILMGGSAGGYMVLNMGLCYPESFAALVACCPAYPFTKFDYNSIEKIYKKPIWIIYAKNDETLKPEKYVEGIINRLENSGATNLHKSVFENVRDTSGKYFMDYTDDIDERLEREEENEIHDTPYQYEGHASWIYLLNDMCNDGDLNLYDWLDGMNN